MSCFYLMLLNLNYIFLIKINLEKLKMSKSINELKYLKICFNLEF